MPNEDQLLQCLQRKSKGDDDVWVAIPLRGDTPVLELPQTPVRLDYIVNVSIVSNVRPYGATVYSSYYRPSKKQCQKANMNKCMMTWTIFGKRSRCCKKFRN